MKGQLMEERKAPLWASFLWQDNRKQQKSDFISFLREVPLFNTLSKRELRTIYSIAHQRTYQENEFVFRKGQPGAAMFIIRSGEINIVDHDEENQENVIATLGNNAFFGELALLDDSPRSASAIATTKTDIFAFFRTDLDRLLAAVPHIGLKVYRALAIIIGIRLKTTNEQLFNK